jgi:hypothetical protein
VQNDKPQSQPTPFIKFTDWRIVVDGADLSYPRCRLALTILVSFLCGVLIGVI